MAFDYTLDFAKIDFRRHPEHYRIGRGEQGVLLVEPYKSEILPHWRFKTPQLARQSADKIYRLFLEYKAAEDFVANCMSRRRQTSRETIAACRFYNLIEDVPIIYPEPIQDIASVHQPFDLTDV